MTPQKMQPLSHRMLRMTNTYVKYRVFFKGYLNRVLHNIIYSVDLIQGGAGTARHAGHVLCGTARHVLNGHVLIRHGTARFEWARFGSARADTL